MKVSSFILSVVISAIPSFSSVADTQVSDRAFPLRLLGEADLALVNEALQRFPEQFGNIAKSSCMAIAFSMKGDRISVEECEDMQKDCQILADDHSQKVFAPKQLVLKASDITTARIDECLSQNDSYIQMINSLNCHSDNEEIYGKMLQAEQFSEPVNSCLTDLLSLYAEL